MNRSASNCDICPIIENPSADEKSLRLHEGEFWHATLRQQDQEYLGTSYVTLRRHAEALDELSVEEELEFITIRNQLLRAQMNAFGAKIVNISCLMNDTFRQVTPAPHVHYHLKPRYSEPVIFEGEEFIDRQFGHYIKEKKPHPVSLEVAQKIAGVLRTEMEL